MAPSLTLHRTGGDLDFAPATVTDNAAAADRVRGTAALRSDIGGNDHFGATAGLGQSLVVGVVQTQGERLRLPDFDVRIRLVGQLVIGPETARPRWGRTDRRLQILPRPRCRVRADCRSPRSHRHRARRAWPTPADRPAQQERAPAGGRAR